VNRLVEYLDHTGWAKTPAGTRRLEKDGWVYDWQTGRGAWMDLWRWPVDQRSTHDIEIFVLKNEDLAIEVARAINSGSHLDSAPADAKTGKKIKFLD